MPGRARLCDGKATTHGRMSGVKRSGLIMIDVAAVLSLLLCIAALVFWVKGKSAAQVVVRESARSYQIITVSRGELSVFYERGIGWAVLEPRADTTYWQWFSHEAEDLCAATAILGPSARAPAAGFFFWRLHWGGNIKTWVLLPMWFVVFVFAVLPLAVCARHVHRMLGARRVAEGCCERCGYDLRASPERCPECGARKGLRVTISESGFQKRPEDTRR
jgi:hypothetical protein